MTKWRSIDVRDRITRSIAGSDPSPLIPAGSRSWLDAAHRAGNQACAEGFAGSLASSSTELVSVDECRQLRL